MIYCKVSDLELYKKYSENMKEAISFIQKNNLNELPFGKTVVNGDKIFINKMESKTQNPENLKYEVHHKYIDIQIDLDGDEKLLITNKSVDCVNSFDQEGDYALYASSEPDSICKMNTDYCVICFPYEIHMPCVKNTADTVIKCVVKVLDDLK